MVHTLKVFLEPQDEGQSEIRRCTVNDDVLNSYSSLCEKIMNLFPSLRGKSFTLGWKDAEGDEIVMSSDEELAQAIANGEDGLIKIIVKVSHQRESVKSKPSTGEIHPSVVCDSCNGKVQGYRYKCLQCEDYDLCSSCHALDHHPGHDMLKISSPTLHPHQWLFPGWRRMWRSMFGHHPFHGRWAEGGRRGRHCKTCDPAAKNTSESEQAGKCDNDAKMAAKEQNAEYLRNIGQSIAFFLDPLGIDVKVDVEQSESESEVYNTKKETKEHSEEAEVKKPKDSEMPLANAEEKCSKNTKASFNYATAREEKSTSKSVVTDSAISAEKVKEPSAGRSSSSDSETSPCGNDDWTVVNAVAPDSEGIASDKMAEATARNTPVQSLKVISSPAEVQSTETVKQGKSAPNTDEQVPMDPQVAKALAQMSAMGFSNDGGWLLRLLEAKKGNITDVLDSLYPNTPHRR